MFNEVWKTKFLAESNRIEGIVRLPSDQEMDAFESFMNLDKVKVADLETLVKVFQPGAKLRDREGMDVSVGGRLCPRGGPAIRRAVEALLVHAGDERCHPYPLHLDYEALHPFMDGNGRSGRALWAWQMSRRYDSLLELGFLHAFYYQTLRAADGRL